MAFDPNEARDDHGRWTEGGGGGGGDISVAPDPRVSIVAGGDIWNKDTAARLENEYAAARPELHKIANQAPEHEGEVAVTTDPSWDALDGTSQEKAEEAYKSNNYDSEYENEVTNWRESGEPERQAAEQLVEDDDWKTETLTDYLAERHDEDKPAIPYSADDLAKAITVALTDDGTGSNHDPDIGFDPQALQKPNDINPTFHPDQLAMPGITPPTDILENHLTPEMRADLTAHFTEQFNNKVEKDAGNVDAPDYLSDNASESVANAWSEMGDEEKYEWTSTNTSLADDLEAEKTTETGSLEPPKKWDPLNETSGSDYVKTQALAKYMADARAVQIMAERGVGGERRRSWGAYSTPDLESHLQYKLGTLDKISGEKSEAATGIRHDIQTDVASIKDELAFRKESGTLPPSIDDIRQVDHDLWDGWKGSSSGNAGQLLQVAAADELGGRLREAAPEKPDVTSAYKEFAGGEAATGGTLSEFHNAVTEAFNKVSDVGGFAAKLSADPNMSYEQKKEAHDALYERSQTAGGPPTLKTELMKEDAVSASYIKLPGLDLQRNGAASFTTDASVANEWGGTTNKAPQGIDRAAVIQKANEDYKQIGGYDGVKAAIRAKWETTQYILDKADVPVLNLYRGITLSHKRETESGPLRDYPVSAVVNTVKGPLAAKELIGMPIGTELKLNSGVVIKKAGEPNLAHDPNSQYGLWQSRENDPVYSRVVLRAEVPRTAVLSVPAYGQNVHSEHEVVITGTAWHNWDAYSDRAPRAEDVPIGKSNAMSAEEKEQIRQRAVKGHEDYEAFKAGKITADQLVNQDIVAKYKKTIPKEQQL